MIFDEYSVHHPLIDTEQTTIWGLYHTSFQQLSIGNLHESTVWTKKSTMTYHGHKILFCDRPLP